MTEYFEFNPVLAAQRLEARTLYGDSFSKLNIICSPYAMGPYWKHSNPLRAWAARLFPFLKLRPNKHVPGVMYQSGNDFYVNPVDFEKIKKLRLDIP